MSRYHEILGLAEVHAKTVGESPGNWMGYLDTAARLYRYPFMDSLLIHAQRPNATACAELPVWNGKMYRWVNRGAKGIALLDRSGSRPGVRYVFDVEDTHPVKGGKEPVLWSVREDNEDRILAHLKSEYHLENQDSEKLAEALIAIAGDKAEEVIGELYRQISKRYPSVLPEITDDLKENELYELMESSMAYMLLSRCGLEPLDHLDAEEFAHVTEYASPFVIASIGSAVQKAARDVLNDIGMTVFRLQREDQAKVVEYRFSREEIENGDNISKERGLSVPGGEADGNEVGRYEEGARGESYIDRGDVEGQIRTASGDISDGESGNVVSGDVDLWGTGYPSHGGREDSTVEIDGADRGVEGEISGTGNDEYDSLGGIQEQPESDGGGDHSERDRVRIENERQEEIEIAEKEAAVEETAVALSLPVLPTAEVQRRKIEERVVALYAGDLTIDPEVVDVVLREGGNRENSIYRIIYDFMLEQPAESHTQFAKNEYGTGGKGLVIDGKDYSVWFDEKGMEIASGSSVHDNLLSKAFLSWEDVSGRIHQLLKQGEYVSQDILDRAKENELNENAQSLCYLVGDIRDNETVRQFFAEPELFDGGYTDQVKRVAARMGDNDFITQTVTSLENLDAAWKEDAGIIRFKWHNIDKLVSNLSRLAMEAVPYQAREDFSHEKPQIFVTQDEIDAFLIRNRVYGGQNRTDVYAFFCRHDSIGKRAKYMRERYGIAGGSSVALPGYGHFGYSYDGKGIVLEKKEEGAAEHKTLLSWNDMAKRIG